MKTLSLVFFLTTSIALSQYSFTVERVSGAQRAGETNLVRVIVSHENKTSFVVERVLPFDVPYPLISINNITGVTALRYVFDGFVEIYGSTGKKIWEHNFFKESEPNYERTIGSVIGNTSIVFLVSDSERDNAVVHRFSMEGALQWTTQLPHQYAYEISMSDDESTIIAGSYLALEDEVRRSAAMINSRGHITGNIDILFRTAVFSDSKEFIALSSEREVVIVSNKTKKELARTEKKTAGIITDMIWRNNEIIVQESEVVTPNDGRFHYANPVMITYSPSLHLIALKKINGVVFQTSVLKKTKSSIELILDAGRSIVPLE